MPQSLDELYSGVAGAPIPDETPIRPMSPPARTESVGSNLDSLYPDQGKKLDDISWQATIKGYLSTASGIAKKAADTVLPGFVDIFQAKQREGVAKTTGNLAALFDMIWNTPTFVVTHGAVAPITAASRMAQGESPDIAYKMGSEGAGTLLEGSPYTNPARKFLEMFKSGKLYEESGTAKGMEKVTETLKAGDKWTVDTLKAPPGSFTLMAEQLMAATPGALKSAKDAAVSARLQKQIAKVRETYIPSDRADFIVSPEGVATSTSPFKPNYVGRPATLDTMYEKPPSMTEAPAGPELSAAAHEQVPISSMAGKPRIKAKVAGSADPEFLSTVAALGMGGATAAILWNESERTGKSILDVIKNWPNRHPAQGEFDQEPVNPETGNALAQNLAAGIPIAGMMIPLRKGSPRELAATALEKGGATRKEVWDKLSVWKPKTDSTWLWELSDREAKIAEGLPKAAGKPGEVSPTGGLFGETEIGDVLKHPELYRTAPLLESAPVRDAGLSGERVGGGYLENSNMFLLKEGSPATLRTRALHEISHWFDKRGELSRGGSPEDFLTPEMKGRREQLTKTIGELKEADPHLAKLDEMLLRDALTKRQAGVALHPAEQTVVRNASNSYKFPELAKTLIERHQLDLEAFRKYRRLAGEARARLVEKRADYTNEERQSRPPWEDFDVPEGEQITRFKVGPALSVKEKGGMWHPETVTRLARAIEPKPDRAQVEANLEYLTPEQRQTLRQELGDESRNIEEYQRHLSLQQWSNRAVRNYLNKWAGTKEDPLRAIEVNTPEGVKTWEEVTDKAFYGREVQGPRGPETQYEISRTNATKIITDHLSHVGDFLKQNYKPEQLQNIDLVRAVKETAAADELSRKALTKNMEKRIEAAKQITAELPESHKVKMYPDGTGWYKIDNKLSEEQIKLNVSVDTLLCEHCVGGVGHHQWGYEGYVPVRDIVTRKSPHEKAPDTNDYVEAIKNGEAIIYSLRDKKGESHVTVEVQPGFKAGGELLEPGQMRRPPQGDPTKDSILQIKGKQNRAPVAEYQKYVQDFVRSGKWSEVWDLENTGLITRGNFRGYEVRLPPEGRGGTQRINADTLGLEEGKYYTPDEIAKLKKDQGGFSTPDFTRTLGLTAAGAAVGAALADPTDKLAGAAIGGLLAFGLSTGAGQRISRKSKIYREVERSITGTIDQFIRKVNPDLLGKDAEQASAILGSNYVEMMRRELEQGVKGEDRRKFWEGRSEAEKNNFIRSLGLPGVKYKDPEIQQLAQYYRKWQQDIQNENKARNIKPTSGDHYANHIFEDPDRAIAYIANKHGNDWYKSPDSVLYVAQAEAAGYKMKSTNPEQVLLAQQHAADIANLKVNALNEIVDAGLARKVKKGDPPPGPGEVLWQSPDGGRYYLSDHANQVMHNAFETPSLWNAPGLGGMTYRGAMWGKNALVPTLLMSMFHPLHITAGMIYGTTGVNAIKLMAAGKLGVGEAGLEMGKSLAFVDTAKTLPYVAKAMQPRGMRAFRGEIDPADLTTLDHLQTQNALDGGFSPEMSIEYRNQHIRAFQDAIRRRSIDAAWNLPFALMEAVWTRPVFENWIPGVKWDAYQKTAAAHLTANPDLMMPENLLEKKVQLRRISKMIDDRFGEMQYKTQFMDNMVKDVAVASFLSYGWQLGFARSYMGAVPEAVSAFTKSDGNALYRPSQGGGTLRERIVRGDLDKTLFLQNYLMSTMLYGGLMTYAFTGEAPKEFLDYIFPKNGDKNPDGTPARVSTPFYTRELVSVPKHIEEEGLAKGLGIVIANKLSPALSLIKGLVTNKDFFDREISNPDAPIATRMGQQLMYTLGQMEPIASSAPRKAGREAVKDYALAAAGFTPAPKYISEGPIETEIKRFLKYHRAAVTPYEKAQRSQSVHELYQLQQLGKTEEFETKLGELTDKYKLGDKEVTRLRKESEIPSVFRQFRMLTEQEQRKVMEKMKPEDITRFKPYTKKVIRKELDE